MELSDAPGTIVARCQTSGQELFAYLDEEGEVRPVGSADVNDYLREITGQDFTAKDFRTWSGTVLAAWALKEFEAVDSEAQAKRNVLRAVEEVAEWLGNTPAVSRKSYVHPAVIDAYLDGDVVRAARPADRKLRDDLDRLEPQEAAVLALLGGGCATRSAGGPRRRRAGAGRAGSPRCPASGRRPSAGDAVRSDIPEPQMGQAQAEVGVMGQRIGVDHGLELLRGAVVGALVEVARASASTMDALPGSNARQRSRSTAAAPG